MQSMKLLITIVHRPTGPTMVFPLQLAMLVAPGGNPPSLTLTKVVNRGVDSIYSETPWMQTAPLGI